MSAAPVAPRMRAVVLDRPGGPGVLQLRDLPSPAPGPGEALLRIRAAGINRLDVWIRQGIYRVQLPHILGAEVAGELLHDSPSGRWKAGGRFVVFPTLHCGKCAACRTGHESLCPTVGILGRERSGGYAEEVAVPEDLLVPLPGGANFESAAALPISYLSAEHALRRAHVRAGESVVVFGSSGALGAALVARAHRRGARVIAVTGAPQNVPNLRILGAEEVLLRGGADLPERVQALTRGSGADVVVDPTGQAVFAPGLRSLARGGRYVSIGVTSGPTSEVDLRWVYSRQLSILGSFLGDRGEFLELVQDLSRGRVEPHISEVLPLEQAAESHRKLDRPHLGKILLRP
jgi:NADPH:quinone reductase-like Zn-dependent oxidoreductase